MKMQFSVYYFSLITYSILQKTYSEDSKPVPGPSGCVYFGSIKNTCGEPNIPIDDLPKECSSFFFYDVFANASLNVVNSYDDPDFEDLIKGMIDNNGGRPAFLYYGHENAEEWINAISCNTQDGGVKAKTEMENLKTYLETYNKLSGLVLENFVIMPNTTNTACLTDNFKIYLDEMRKSFPDYGIGFDIIGTTMIDLLNDPNHPEWLDFKVLDSYIDFYILSVYFFNNCTDEFKVGGTTPLNGSAKYTLEKLLKYVEDVGIPKNKVYILYKAGPRATDFSISSCEVTSAKFCASPTNDCYCADNTQSYYDKGVYAKKNVAGFIGWSIDLIDDPYGCCQCGTKYPAFYDMLAGFNCDSVPAPCPLLDK